jgi:hypothetical protein
LEMLDECGASLPHTWIAGDDEMGRPRSLSENSAAGQGFGRAMCTGWLDLGTMRVSALSIDLSHSREAE